MNEIVYAVPFSYEGLERLLFVLREAQIEVPLSRESEAFVDRLTTRLHLILNPVVR